MKLGACAGSVATGVRSLSQDSKIGKHRATLLVPRLCLGMHDLEAPPPWSGRARHGFHCPQPMRGTTGREKLSQKYLICHNRSTMQCRARFQTCPFFRNPTKGGYKPAPISGCLLSTANCNSIRHPLSSVSASMSWHDLGFSKNSKTASESLPHTFCRI